MSSTTSDSSILSPPIQAASLLERCMNDPMFVCMLLGKFAPQLDQMMAQIDAAIAAGDADKIARAAHSLKGAAANLSADAIRLEAKRLEDAVHGIETIALTEVAAEIRRHIEECSKFVPELIARLKCSAPAGLS